MMKGFQYRWVIVDSRFGVLEYYEREEHKNSYKPRASLSLVYATVCPSDEDSQTFVVNTSQGENIRLKATNARERQLWVNHIRAVAEYHTERANEQASISSLPSLQRPSLLPIRETRPAMLNSSNSAKSDLKTSNAFIREIVNADLAVHVTGHREIFRRPIHSLCRW
ncbi:unnamed protein product [Hymenolepis diminuta]|uniref:PH domain-containing protein n=1 Tax=Hymenolepis diminuta TaxID=6216 RepID=A0A0R3SQ41_HYMDI|nr:unnamed protein product [Hymenolepis diminuta]